MVDSTARVYVGPTVSRDEVREIVPSAQIRPPVARGDLYRESWQPGDVALLIDGYYRDRLSVGHKEILWLMSLGVHVVGAASMGALRAAELAPMGMRGVGEIFRMYREREIDGDDEVAIMHASVGSGYVAHTVALVNVRYACCEGVAADVVSPAAADEITRVAASLPFTHRSWEELEQALDGACADALATVRHSIDRGEHDLKRIDALSALRLIDQADAWPPHSEQVVSMDVLSAIVPSEVLRWTSTREYRAGRLLSDLDILHAVRLFSDDYPKFHEEALAAQLRELATASGQAVGDYVASRLGVNDDALLPSSVAHWLTESELASLNSAELLRLVAVRVWPVWQSPDWRPLVISRLRESPRWQEWTDLAIRADEVAEEKQHKMASPPHSICGNLFVSQWQRTNGSDVPDHIEVARRGFLSVEEVGKVGSRYFPLAMDLRRQERERSSRTSN